MHRECLLTTILTKVRQFDGFGDSNCEIAATQKAVVEAIERAIYLNCKVL